MPIFEFKCVQCGNVFEKLFVHSNDKLDMGCPECQCETLERVVSRANMALGSGPGGNQPKLTTKSCASGNQCYTLDLPGPSK